MLICPICKNEMKQTETIVVERWPGFAMHKFCRENIETMIVGENDKIILAQKGEGGYQPTRDNKLVPDHPPRNP